MTDHTPAAGIKSEARGPHWVAWVPGIDGKPERSVILVGRTRKEAEDRARRWAELNSAG